MIMTRLTDFHDPQLVLHKVVDGLRQSDVDEVRGVMGACPPADVVDRLMLYAPRSIVAHSEGDDETLLTFYALGGLEPLKNRAAEAWILGTNAFNKAYIPLTRRIKRDILPQVVRGGLRRIECHSIASHVAAHKWLRILGAGFEADEIGFGVNGETFKRFAWSFD